MLQLIAMHYCIFWDVLFSCFRHVIHHTLNFSGRGMQNCALWNHRLQTVVHKIVIDSFYFYLYNNFLFVNSWQKLLFKVFFFGSSYDLYSLMEYRIFYGAQVCTKVSQTKRSCTEVHDAGSILCVSYKNAERCNLHHFTPSLSL